MKTIAWHPNMKLPTKAQHIDDDDFCILATAYNTFSDTFTGTVISSGRQTMYRKGYSSRGWNAIRFYPTTEIVFSEAPYSIRTMIEKPPR